jgi:hypothetical protein
MSGATGFVPLPDSPPVAVLQAAPSIPGGEDDLPLLINFDASGSYDPDGVAITFWWDWEGDGVYDLYSGTDPTVQHEYTTSGQYNATVKVTDVQHLIDTASVLIDVHNGP